MAALETVLVVLVALLHGYILVLEMFLWRTPRGRRAMNNRTRRANVEYLPIEELV